MQRRAGLQTHPPHPSTWISSPQGNPIRPHLQARGSLLDSRGVAGVRTRAAALGTLFHGDARSW
jgi:hypothetical protein